MYSFFLIRFKDFQLRANNPIEMMENKNITSSILFDFSDKLSLQFHVISRYKNGIINVGVENI